MKIIEGVGVQRVLTKEDAVTGVETDRGKITCEYFVNAAGQVGYSSFWLDWRGNEGLLLVTSF